MAIEDIESKVRQYDSEYRAVAIRWIAEVIIISLFASILNWVLFINDPNPNPLLIFIINVSIVVVASLLLFRHIDTLIFKRIYQVRESDISTQDHRPQKGKTVQQEPQEKGNSIDKKGENGIDSNEPQGLSNIVEQRKSTDLLPRIVENTPIAIGYIITFILGGFVGLWSALFVIGLFGELAVVIGFLVGASLGMGLLYNREDDSIMSIAGSVAYILFSLFGVILAALFSDLLSLQSDSLAMLVLLLIFVIGLPLTIYRRQFSLST